MQIDTETVAETSARLERLHGSRLKPAPARPTATEILPAERLARVAAYVNENRVFDDTAALERAIGTNDLLSLYYFWSGLRAARSVGRIRIAPVPGDPGGSATGFLVAPNLLLTNWHVFKAEEAASRARVQFSFESDANGNERVSTWFSLLPGKFFINNKELDYCFVSVDPDSKQGPEALESFGWLRLNPQLGKADYGQFLSIIQHPGGQTKQIAIRENRLFEFKDEDNFLTYQSDTFRGSSGSPVFNDLWDVVALHHSGKPLKDEHGNFVGHDGNPITDHKPLEHEIKWIANEGARTSKIVKDFLSRAPEGSARSAFEAVLKDELRPQVQPVELANPKPGLEPLPNPPALPRVTVPETGFVAMLPLNVSIKVESLAQAAQPAAERPAVSLVTAPTTAIVKATEPDEFLFEKLNFDTDYSDRSGYDEDFLGRERRASMPTIDSAGTGQIAPTRKRGRILHYHHFSLMVHAKRRMPVLAAWNTDYSKGQRKIKGRETFGKDEWIIDDRMEEKYQLPKGFYDRWKKLDYGHLVRRDDNCWGASKTEIEYANSDTFHLTNCTPQHEAFNRDKFGFHGLWGRLENLISSQAQGDRSLARMSIFAGPIFGTKDLKLEDEEAGNVFVPLAFWKVVVAPTSRGGVRAYAFITSQKQDLADEPPFEDFTPKGFHNEQATLAKIEEQTIVRFSDALKEVDVMLDHPEGHELMPLEGAEEIWMGQR